MELSRRINGTIFLILNSLHLRSRIPYIVLGSIICVCIIEVFDTHHSPFGEWKIDYYDCMLNFMPSLYVSVEGSGRHLINIIFSNGYSSERYIRHIIEHKYDV